jgi:hypothetical protein
MDMASVLEAYEAMRGDLRGIPFILSRVPRMVSTPSGQDGKRARREKWLWHLEAQPTWVQAQLSVMQRAALPSGTTQLSSGSIVDVETGEIFEDDYEDETVVTGGKGNDEHNSVNYSEAKAEMKADETPSPIDPDNDIDNSRVWLEGVARGGKVEYGFVLDAAAMTSLYSDWNHAYNALVGDDGYAFPGKFDASKRKQTITLTGGLAIYDWLMARKQD